MKIISFGSMALSALLMAGCASVYDINKGYYQVNSTDGINEHEAIVIAQHDLSQNEKQHSFRVALPVVKEAVCREAGTTTNVWKVVFSSKPDLSFLRPEDDGLRELFYYITRDSGKVVNVEVSPRGWVELATSYDPAKIQCEGQ